MNYKQRAQTEIAKRCAHCPKCKGIREFRDLNKFEGIEHQVKCTDCKYEYWLIISPH